MEVDGLLLVSKMTKNLILAKYIENSVSVIQIKSSLFTSVFIFSNISKILDTKM